MTRNANAWKSPGRPEYELCELCRILRPTTALLELPPTMDKQPKKYLCKNGAACHADKAILEQMNHAVRDADAMLEAHASAPPPPKNGVH